MLFLGVCALLYSDKGIVQGLGLTQERHCMIQHRDLFAILKGDNLNRIVMGVTRAYFLLRTILFYSFEGKNKIILPQLFHVVASV